MRKLIKATEMTIIQLLDKTAEQISDNSSLSDESPDRFLIQLSICKLPASYFKNTNKVRYSIRSDKRLLNYLNLFWKIKIKNNL